MAHIDEAFGFIVPKYRYHSNQAMMVIENRWQAQDYIEPRLQPCNSLQSCNSLQPCNSLKYPASGNLANGRDVVRDYALLSETARSPSAVLNDWTGLPPVPLPFIPAANLGLTREGAVKTPMYWNESLVCGAKCSTIDHCDNICEKLRGGGTGNYHAHEPGMWKSK